MRRQINMNIICIHLLFYVNMVLKPETLEYCLLAYIVLFCSIWIKNDFKKADVGKSVCAVQYKSLKSYFLPVMPSTTCNDTRYQNQKPLNERE